MENQFSKEIESDLIKLGLYQIFGGVIGIFIIIWGLYKTKLMTGLSVLFTLFIILIFLYSIYCGTLCIKAKKNALVHSLTNQIFQLFGFALLGFAFKYVAGFYLTIVFDLTNSFEITFGFGTSKFEFNFRNQEDRIEIDFNLIAFLFIYWIDNLMKNVKEETRIRKINSIGQS